MSTTKPITNTEDIIDSRTIIERIDYINYHDECCPPECEDLHHEDDCPENCEETHYCNHCSDGDEHEELEKLRAFVQILRDEAGVYGDTPEDGITLISDDYFDGAFAEQEAEEYGMIPSGVETNRWPFTCLDWDKAAEELKQDYTKVDFDGKTYWAR